MLRFQGVLAILVADLLLQPLVPVEALESATSATAIPACNGKYKGGLSPSPEELQDILIKYGRWLNKLAGARPRWLCDKDDGDPDRANLCEADLIAANLQKAHLAGANLTDADLMSTDLAGARLEGADCQKIHPPTRLACLPLKVSNSVSG